MNQADEDRIREIHRALIECMTLAGAADGKILPEEMHLIGSMVAHLPVFKDFDLHDLPVYVESCLQKLMNETKLDDLLEDICKKIPKDLRETAYALAVDVVAADLYASEAELNFLQMLRQILKLDRLICAGIERGARAHFKSII